MFERIRPVPFLFVLVFSVVGGGAAGGVELVQRLTQGASSPSDLFGFAVAAGDGELVVGAPNSGSPGQVYVYRQNGHRWQETQRLAPATPAYEAFGSSVALAGDTLVVGASYAHEGELQTGAVYVYERVGMAWEPRGRFVPEGLSDWALFGESVAVEGDVIVAAAHTDNRFPAAGVGRHGSVHVYGRDGPAGEWGYRARIVHPSERATRTRRFGQAIALAGTFLAVGTWDNEVVIFSRGGPAGEWAVDDQLINYDFEVAGFGESLAFAGDRLLVGAHGLDSTFDDIRPWVFAFRRGGALGWQQVDQFHSIGARREDFFAGPVAVDETGDRLAVAAPLDDDRGLDTGSVFVFDLGVVPARLEEIIYAPDADAGDLFGASIDFRDGLLFVGSQADGDHAEAAGAVYVIDLDRPPPAEPAVAIQPAGGVFQVGSNIELTVLGYGLPPLEYQWFKDGVVLPGQTGTRLRFQGLGAADAGRYSAVVSNPFGETETEAAEIFVNRESPVLVDRFPAERVTPGGITLDNRSWVVGTTALFSGSRLVEGKKRATYDLYELDASTRRWGRAETFSPPAEADEYAALGEDIVVIGKQVDDNGSFYVLERDPDGSWGEPVTVTPRFGPGEPWGRSYAVDGDTILAGYSRMGYRGLEEVGEIAVFEREAGGETGWRVRGVVRPTRPYADGRFAEQIAVDGDTLMASALQTRPGGSWEPVVYFFRRRPSVPGGWEVESRLVVDPAEGFGVIRHALHLDVSGDTAVLSAPVRSDDGGRETTSVYRFEWTPGGGWGSHGLLDSLSPRVRSGGIDGVVSIHGDRVAVGSSAWSQAGSDAGAVHLFERDAGGEDSWGWIKALLPPEPEVGLRFGAYATLFGEGEVFVSTGIHSSPGAVFHFRDLPGVPITQAWEQWYPSYYGRSAEFVAVVGGDSPLSYQWHKDGEAIPGATDAVLRVDFGVGDDGVYSAIVQGERGVVETVRYDVTLEDSPPFFASQPRAQDVISGHLLALEATADGSGPLHLQWFKDGVALPGANGPELRIDDVPVGASGAYWLEASNPLGNARSESVVVTVREEAPVLHVQPMGRHAELGERVEFWVVAGGSGPVSFQWFRAEVALEGETGPTLELPRVDWDDRGLYHVLLTNPAGSTASEGAELTVDLLPLGRALHFGRDLGDPVTYNLAADGNTVAAADFRYERPETEGWKTGIVHLFDYDPERDSWVRSGMVTGAGPREVRGRLEEDGFARSLGLGGGRLAVGSATAPTNGGGGADDGEGIVQIYGRESGVWQLEAEIPGGPGYKGFGGAISLSADRLVAATEEPVAGLPSAPSVFLFGRTPSGVWEQEWAAGVGAFGRVWFSDHEGGTVVSGQTRGFSVFDVEVGTDAIQEEAFDADQVSGVNLSGDTLVVALSDHSIRVHGRGGDVAWVRTRELRGDFGEQNEFFGSPMAFDGRRLAAFGDAHGGGAIYVFERDAGGPENWGRVAKITVDDIEGATGISRSLALVGDTVVGGAEGRETAFYSLLLPRNSPPAFATRPPGVAAEVGRRFTHRVEAVDGDAGDSLVFRPERLPPWLHLSDLGEGVALLEGTPGAGDVGVFSVVIAASDFPYGSQSRQRFDLQVILPPQPPRAIGSGEVTLPAGAAATEIRLQDLFEDDDSPFDSLRFSVRQVTGGFLKSARVSGDGLFLRFDQGSDPAEIIVRATDPGGLFAEARLRVVRPAAPEILSQPVGRDLSAGEAFFLVVDAEGGGPLGFRWFKDGVVIPGAEGSRLDFGAVAEEDAGVYTVEVRNEVGLALSAPAEVAVAAGELPRGVTGDPPPTALEDAVYSTRLASRGGAAGFAFLAAPAWLQMRDLGNGTATLSGTPRGGDVGQHDVRIGLSFAGGDLVEFEYQVEVLAVNDPPFLAVGAVAPLVLGEGDSPHEVDFSRWAGDEEDSLDRLRLTAFDEGAAQSPVEALVVDGLRLEIRLKEGVHGSTTVRLELADTGGATVSAALPIEVRPVNHPPEAKPVPPLALRPGVDAAVIDLGEFFSDPDEGVRGELSYRVLSVAGDPVIAVARIGRGSFLEVFLEPGRSGRAEMLLRASDGGGLEAEARWVIMVEPSPDALPPPAEAAGPTGLGVAALPVGAFGERSGLELRWRRGGGRPDRIEVSSTLEPSSWKALATVPPGIARGADFVLWDFTPRHYRRFYRSTWGR